MKTRKKENQPKKFDTEKTELENLCKRVQADFENYRKRTQQEKEEFSKYANTDLILQILPVIDNFKLATQHLPPNLKNNSWAQGVLQIEKQLEQILVAEGVESIKALGKEYDPHLHEAIEEVESDKPSGEVVEEVSRGYKINDKVIRHVKVKVSK